MVSSFSNRPFVSRGLTFDKFLLVVFLLRWAYNQTFKAPNHRHYDKTLGEFSQKAKSYLTTHFLFCKKKLQAKLQRVKVLEETVNLTTP